MEFGRSVIKMNLFRYEYHLQDIGLNMIACVYVYKFRRVVNILVINCGVLR